VKYLKKPIVVEAVCIKYAEYASGAIPDEPMFEEMPSWLEEALKDGVILAVNVGARDYWSLSIHTLDGPMIAHPDDWIIQGINGELYPCKSDIFQKTYDILFAEKEE